MTTSTEIKSIVREVLRELLAGESNGETLGFHSESEVKRQYVFVNRSKGDCLWYTFDNEAKKHNPITHNKISGKFEGFSFRETTYKNKPNTKLVLRFDCGEQGLIYLESAIDTTFSRITLLTLSQMPSEAQQERITLEVAEGSEESVILPSFYVNGQRQNVEFPENFKSIDIDPFVREASIKFNGEDILEDF